MDQEAVSVMLQTYVFSQREFPLLCLQRCSLCKKTMTRTEQKPHLYGCIVINVLDLLLKIIDLE